MTKELLEGMTETRSFTDSRTGNVVQFTAPCGGSINVSPEACLELV